MTCNLPDHRYADHPFTPPTEVIDRNAHVSVARILTCAHAWKGVSLLRLASRVPMHLMYSAQPHAYSTGTGQSSTTRCPSSTRSLVNGSLSCSNELIQINLTNGGRVSVSCIHCRSFSNASAGIFSRNVAAKHQGKHSNLHSKPPKHAII